MTEQKSGHLGRREFMHSAAAAGAAVATFGILNPANADDKGGGETLKVGLIGLCLGKILFGLCLRGKCLCHRVIGGR